MRYEGEFADPFSGYNEQYYDGIGAMSKSFLQLFKSSEDVYVQNVVKHSICFAYDLARQIGPSDRTIVAAGLFDEMDLASQPSRVAVHEMMTHIASDYLTHRQHLTAIIEYFLPAIDPSETMHSDIESVIAYVLMHIELNNRDQFIDSQVESFRLSIDRWSDKK